MKRYEREREAFRIDEEERMCEQIEEDMLADVRYLIARVREMSGHEGGDVCDPQTGDPMFAQCDCNRWNRVQLFEAIRKLRAWRRNRIYCA